MRAVFSQLQAATGVHLCLSSCFATEDRNKPDLVIVRGTTLEVFNATTTSMAAPPPAAVAAVTATGDGDGGGGSANGDSSNGVNAAEREHGFIDADTDDVMVSNSNKNGAMNGESVHENHHYQPLTTQTKLELIGKYPLHGVVGSMCAVRFAQCRRDSLVFAFGEAKIAVVDFHVATRDIKTVSLHCFEREGFRKGCHQFGGGEVEPTPLLRSDPSQRMAAALFFDLNLAVLPFRPCGHGGRGAGVTTARMLPSYVIRLEEVDSRIHKVIDFLFLDDYYEPTVLVMYEEKATWAGLWNTRMDTVNVVAITLSLSKQKKYSIVWETTGLPSQSHSLLAVPRPLNGALVIAVNELIHLNQSSTSLGISLNEFSKEQTHFPDLVEQEGVVISLEGALAVFISADRVFFTLGNGQLFVVTLVHDSRNVRGFRFERAASSVPAHCICTLGSEHFFLGSLVGDSLFISYEEKRTALVARIPKVPTAGKGGGFDEDDLFAQVYGDEEEAAHSSYSFKVCDSLVNLGPIASMAIGRPAFVSEEISDPARQDFETVMACGRGNAGALCVSQRGIVPEIVTSFDLPGTSCIFTILAPAPPTEALANEDGQLVPPDADWHGFLLLSNSKTDELAGAPVVGESTVLATGEELTSVDAVANGFGGDVATLYAGNLGGRRFAVQVYETGVRLLEGLTQLQFLSLDDDESRVTACHVCDPCLLLRCRDGSLTLLTLDVRERRLVADSAPLSIAPEAGGAVMSACVFRDASGLFIPLSEQENLDDERDDVADNRINNLTNATPTNTWQNGVNVNGHNLEMEEEEEEEDEDEDYDFLYGGAEMSMEEVVRAASRGVVPNGPNAGFGMNTFNGEGTTTRDYRSMDEETLWCAVARRSGALEIYALPDWSLAMVVHNFSLGPTCLQDGGGPQALVPSMSSQLPCVTELLLVGLGERGATIALVALVDGRDLLVYNAFPYSHAGAVPPGRLPVRFTKSNHGHVLRDPLSWGTEGGGIRSETPCIDDMTDVAIDGETGLPICGNGDEKSIAAVRQRLFHFSNIGGYTGIFICGNRPLWIMVGNRRTLRFHTMWLDGEVVAFAPFHNVNCHRGFLYATAGGDLRIAELNNALNFDLEWPARKIALRCTPIHIGYHPPSQTYALVTSIARPCRDKPLRNNEIPEKDENDNFIFEQLDRGPRFIYPTLDEYSLNLVSPVTWETVHQIVMRPYERIMDMKIVNLKVEAAGGKTKPFIALATMFAYGEDVTARGCIHIYEIIDVVPDPDNPQTNHKYKRRHRMEQRAPCLVVAETDGNLLTVIGQKIVIHHFRDSENLLGTAFVFTTTFVNSVATLGNFIISGDYQRSTQLLRHVEGVDALTRLGSDHLPLSVSCVDFMVHRNELALLVSDAWNNVVIQAYEPDNPEAFGGQLIMRHAEFHVGSHVSALSRLRCPPEVVRRGFMATPSRRHLNLMGTRSGALCALLPITSDVYDRLMMLSGKMVTTLPHRAGLHPRGFRQVRSNTFLNCRNNGSGKYSILDLQLLGDFPLLGGVEQRDLARQIGTTTDKIIDDLLNIELAVALF